MLHRKKNKKYRRIRNKDLGVDYDPLLLFVKPISKKVNKA